MSRNAVRKSLAAKPRISTSSARSPAFPFVRYAASLPPWAWKLPFAIIGGTAAKSIAHGFKSWRKGVQFLRQLLAQHFDLKGQPVPVRCCRCRQCDFVQRPKTLIEIAADMVQRGKGFCPLAAVAGRQAAARSGSGLAKGFQPAKRIDAEARRCRSRRQLGVFLVAGAEMIDMPPLPIRLLLRCRCGR